MPGLREAKGKAKDVDDENDGNGKPVNEDHVLVIRTASTYKWPLINTQDAKLNKDDIGE